LYHRGSIRAVEVRSRTPFEIRDVEVKNDDVEIRRDKLEDTVAFHNHELLGLKDRLELRHGPVKLALLGAQPQRAAGAGNKEAGRIGPAFAALFLQQSIAVLFSGAAAGASIDGADSVAVLGYLHRCPTALWESGNQSRRQGSLSNIAGMSADDNNRHRVRSLLSGAGLMPPAVNRVARACDPGGLV